MTEKPLLITFAGHPGSGKTPVAYYLSQNLNLPIFNNDAIRTEVHEDTLSPDFDNRLYESKRQSRLSNLLDTRRTFIYDASVDRRWKDLRKELHRLGYRFFIIGFNLSLEFRTKVWAAKGSSASPEQLARWQEDQRNFFSEYGAEVGLVITDSNFARRFELALSAVTPLIKA